jgi:hypothetical protein
MYKSDVQNAQLSQGQEQSNMIYILYVPVILYICYYLIVPNASSNNGSIVYSSKSSSGSSSQGLLSKPYPGSVSISSLSTN